MLSQTFEPKITPDQSCPCLLQPSAGISKQNIGPSRFSPHLKPLEFPPSALSIRTTFNTWSETTRISEEAFKEHFKTTGLASPDSRGFRHRTLVPHFHMDWPGFILLFDNKKSLRVPKMLFTEECVGNTRQMGGRRKSENESGSEVWTSIVIVQHIYHKSCFNCPWWTST